MLSPKNWIISDCKLEIQYPPSSPRCQFLKNLHELDKKTTQKTPKDVGKTKPKKKRQNLILIAGTGWDFRILRKQKVNLRFWMENRTWGTQKDQEGQERLTQTVNRIWKGTWMKVSQTCWFWIFCLKFSKHFLVVWGYKKHQNAPTEISNVHFNGSKLSENSNNLLFRLKNC